MIIEQLKTVEKKYQKLHSFYQNSFEITNKIILVLSEENFEEVQKLITERETNLYSAEKLLNELQIIKAEIIKKYKLNKFDKNEINQFSASLAESIDNERLKTVEIIANTKKIQQKIEEKFESIKNGINKKVSNVDVTKKIHNAYNKSKIIKPVGSFIFL